MNATNYFLRKYAPPLLLRDVPYLNTGAKTIQTLVCCVKMVTFYNHRNAFTRLFRIVRSRSLPLVV
jgi:hypothetical protein